MEKFSITDKALFKKKTREYVDSLPAYFNKLEEAIRYYPDADKNQEYCDYVIYHKWPIRQLEYSYVIRNVKPFVQKGCSILEAGCGVSPMPFLWKGEGANVTAFDMAENTIQLMRKLAEDNYFNLSEGTLQFVQGDISDLPFPDQSFDIIETVSVLEHLPYPNYLRALSELYRVLKPNGILVCTCDLASATRKKIGDIGAFSVGDIQNFLEPFSDELLKDRMPFQELSVTQSEIDNFWESWKAGDVGYEASRGYIAVGFSIQRTKTESKPEYLFHEEGLNAELRATAHEYMILNSECAEKEKQIRILHQAAEERLRLIQRMTQAVEPDIT